MNNEFNNLNNGTNSESNYQNQLNQNNMEQQVISNPNVKKYASSKKKDRRVALIMMAVMIVIYLLLFFTLYLSSAEPLKKSNNKSEPSNNTINNNNNNGNNSNSSTSTNDDTTITYQGYKFFKLTGYTYEITSEYLKVTNENAGILIGINIIDDTYNEFETLSDADLKTQIEQELSSESIKVNSLKRETVSGRNYIIADLEDYRGKYIMFLTKADNTHCISGLLIDSKYSAAHSNLSYASMVLLGVSAAIK